MQLYTFASLQRLASPLVKMIACEAFWNNVVFKLGVKFVCELIIKLLYTAPEIPPKYRFKSPLAYISKIGEPLTVILFKTLEFSARATKVDKYNIPVSLSL